MSRPFAGDGDRLDAVLGNSGKDGHELTVATGLGVQPILHLQERWRQRPILERLAVAQCPRLLLHRCHVALRVEARVCRRKHADADLCGLPFARLPPVRFYRVQVLDNARETR